MNTTDTNILVLGATGKTGSRVAARLTALGVNVRAGSRSATPAFDWEDPDTWGPALDGVDAVYISYYPDLAVPTAPDAVGALSRLAADKGVQRLVLLSGRGESEAQRAEHTMAQAGVPWTVVRCSWFMQNFTEGAFAESIAAGELALPVGDVPEPFVDVDDIADVAVAALTEDGHAGEVYELTGPRLLTFAQAVEEISQAAGKPVAFAPIGADEFLATMREYGVPEPELELLAFLFTEVLDGRNAHLNDGVQRALGRAPRDFAEFAKRAFS
jgi:uncharacterized protein YbjT (DUF2867 family)